MLRRDGTVFFVEVLVAIALLAIVAGTSVHLVQSELQQSRACRSRTRRIIQIDNCAAWLSQAMADEDWTEATLRSKLQQMPGDDSAANGDASVQMEVQPFKANGRTGVHVVLRQRSLRSMVQRDLWHFEKEAK